MGITHRRLRYPSSLRLKNARTIRRIVADGGRLVRHGLIVHWLPGTQDPTTVIPQVAIVAARQSGGAVLRNRIRRRLREAVRLNRLLWPHNTGIVLRARGVSLARMPFQDLVSDIGQIFRRIGASHSD